MLHWEPIYHDVIRRRIECVERALHGNRSCSKDIPTVDFPHGCGADPDTCCRRHNPFEQFFTYFCRQSLRVIGAVYPHAVGKDDSGRNDGPSQGTPTSLIDTRHRTTATPEPPLVFKQVLGSLRP
jgi:hypothetical protein